MFKMMCGGYMGPGLLISWTLKSPWSLPGASGGDVLGKAWQRAGHPHPAVRTVMGCCDECLSIMITTFLALNLWFVFIFWLVLFHYLFFHSVCLFFLSSISVVFPLFPFWDFKAPALKNFSSWLFSLYPYLSSWSPHPFLSVLFTPCPSCRELGCCGVCFVEDEPRRKAGGVQEQDLSIEYLLPKAFCTMEVLSWPFKLMQSEFDLRRDFVTLHHTPSWCRKHCSYSLVNIYFSQLLVLNSSTFQKQWLCHRVL